MEKVMNELIEEKKQVESDLKATKKEVALGSVIVPVSGVATAYFAYNAINNFLNKSFNAGLLASAASIGFGIYGLAYAKRTKQEYKASKQLNKRLVLVNKQIRQRSK